MASSNSTPAAKKRTRSQNEEEPASTASKKRRLRSADDTLTTTSQSLKPSSTVNGTSGRKRRVPAVQDALADSWEVPDSGHEPKLNKDQTRNKKLQAPVTSQNTSVYDVPDSGEDELGTPALTGRPQRQNPSIATVVEDGGDAASLTKGDESVKRKRGRPRKRDRKAPVEVRSGVPVAKMSPSPSPSPAEQTSRSAGHGSPSRVLPEAENEEPASDVEIKSLPVPKTRRPRVTAKSRLEEAAQLPKGILTPRKRGDGGDRRQKSVAFDNRPDEGALEELAAESPSKSTRKRRQPAPKEIVDEIEIDGEPEANEQGSDEVSGSDEEDDEVCAICSKPDSDPPNEIVFCDNCDMPVHQECYGLAEVPEGDWICRNCSQEGASLASGGGIFQTKSSVVAQADQKPDIPNFDQHLRSTQRVLLDRCAGRRRIKLRGQDEAYKKTHQLVEQTIVAGEGNSMLVIGARGCGKTTVSCPVFKVPLITLTAVAVG